MRSKVRLFATLFFILAVPTAILLILIAMYVRDDLQKKAIRQNSLTARLVAKSVDEEFFSLRRAVEEFAGRPRVLTSIPKNDRKWLEIKLEEMVRQNSHFTRGFVTDEAGNFLAEYPVSTNLLGRNFAYRDWYKGASNREDAYVSEIYQRVNMDHADVVTICSRVKGTNGVIGYLAGQFNLDKLGGWLHSMKPSANGIVELYDQNGVSALMGSSEQPGSAFWRVASKTMSGREGSLQTKDPLNGEENLVSYVRVTTIGWLVLARQPVGRVFQPIQTLFQTICLFSFVCFMGMAIIGYFWFDTLSRYDLRRQRSENELRARALELKRSNEELEGLCYSIAHDLRAPLRAIRGFTSALKEDYTETLDRAGQNYTHRIDESAGRMDQLIQDLLDYGRLGHAELPTERISLHESVELVVDSLADEIKSKNAIIEVDKPLPGVVANPTILNQVLTNIVSNGLKFVALGVTPKIKISAEIQGKTVRINVRDNGIGIDPSHHKRIFGVFERLHSYESYPGTGIGLAIVRKGIERMGGRVGLDSKIGDGCCFWLELPKA